MFKGKRNIKKNGATRHITVKSVSERIQLHIPPDKLQKVCAAKGYGNYQTTKAIHKKEWTQSSDAEIILAYNGELRGFANYYALALNATTVRHKRSQLPLASLLYPH